MDWSSLATVLEGLEWLRLDLLVRLLLAAVLGGTVGLEREFSGKPAGFRTNLLICVGAALLTDLSILVSQAADPAETNADPARIAAQIVSGIGFLGAGTIIQSRGSVVGLTTAATLWVVAAIGMAVGAGGYVEAIGTTILVIVALILLGRVEERLAEPGGQIVAVRVAPDTDLFHAVERVIAGDPFRGAVDEVERTPDEYAITARVPGRRPAAEALMRALLGIDGVRRVTLF